MKNQQQKHQIKRKLLCQLQNNKIWVRYGSNKHQHLVLILQEYIQQYAIKQYIKNISDDTNLMNIILQSYKTIDQFINVFSQKNKIFIITDNNKNSASIYITNEFLQIKMNEGQHCMQMFIRDFIKLKQDVNKYMAPKQYKNTEYKINDNYQYQYYDLVNQTIQLIKKTTKHNQNILEIKVRKDKQKLKSIQMTLTGVFKNTLKSYKKLYTSQLKIYNARQQPITLNQLLELLKTQITIQQYYNDQQCFMQIYSPSLKQSFKFTMKKYPVLYQNRLQYQLDYQKMVHKYYNIAAQQCRQYTDLEIMRNIQKLRQQILNITDGIQQSISTMSNSCVKNSENIQKQLTVKIQQIRQHICSKQQEHRISISEQIISINEYIHRNRSEIENKFLRIILDSNQQKAQRNYLLDKKWDEIYIDRQCKCFKDYKLHCLSLFQPPQLQFNDNQTNKQILTTIEAKKQSVNFTITKSSKYNIWMGIIDKKYRDQINSLKSKNFIAFTAWNGKIRVSGKDVGQQKRLCDNETVKMQIKDDQVYWLVDQQIRGRYKSPKIEDPQIQWVYFVTMYDKGDRIKISR